MLHAVYRRTPSKLCCDLKTASEDAASQQLTSIDILSDEMARINDVSGSLATKTEEGGKGRWNHIDPYSGSGLDCIQRDKFQTQAISH